MENWETVSVKKTRFGRVIVGVKVKKSNRTNGLPGRCSSCGEFKQVSEVFPVTAFVVPKTREIYIVTVNSPLVLCQQCLSRTLREKKGYDKSTLFFKN